MRTLNVGALAKESGINPETVRYYERIGLMPKPKRKESHYRYYEEDDLARLVFIVRAKELGFTLKEIKELLAMRIDENTKCADMKSLAERKILDIENRIRDLRSISEHLSVLAGQCTDGEVSLDECPVVKALAPSLAHRTDAGGRVFMEEKDEK